MIIGYLDLDPWGLEKIDDKGIRNSARSKQRQCSTIL